MTKTNNKGFSLVELIIVIAIMAVLVGILAPQFVQYVERSRESTDIKNVTEITTAFQVYAVDPVSTTAFTDGDTLVLDGTAATNDSAIDLALENAGLDTSYDCASATYADAELIVNVGTNGALSFDVGNGTVDTQYSAVFGF